jgi:hypothetical protein
VKSKKLLKILIGQGNIAYWAPAQHISNFSLADSMEAKITNWELPHHQKAIANIADKQQMIVYCIKPVNVHASNLEYATNIGVRRLNKR